MLIVEDDDPDLSCGYYGEDWYYKGQPFTGRIVARHDNGNIESGTDYLDGILSTQRTYFPDGTLQIESESRWNEGRFHQRRYFPNGELELEKSTQSGLGQWQIQYSPSGEVLCGVGRSYKFMPAHNKPPRKVNPKNVFSKIATHAASVFTSTKRSQ
jgi:hypothetical protein